MRQAIGPQASDLGIGLNQFHLLVAATRQLQILNGLLIDAEHRRSRTILRRHVGDSGAITQRQRTCTFTIEFQIGTDYL